MERLYRLAEIFIEGNQGLNQGEEQRDLLGIQSNKLGNTGWRKGVDKQDDGTDGDPDLGVYLGVFLAEGRLEDRRV